MGIHSGPAHDIERCKLCRTGMRCFHAGSAILHEELFLLLAGKDPMRDESGASCSPSKYVSGAQDYDTKVSSTNQFPEQDRVFTIYGRIKGES